MHVSFETPEYTANTDALGTLRILEAIKTLKLINKTKFYQAGTSELYGLSGKKFKFQDEKTLFHPRNPSNVHSFPNQIPLHHQNMMIKNSQ